MYKKWTSKALVILMIILIVFVSINYIIDPYQHYRKSTIYPSFYGGNQRYLNPGLAKNHSFTDVIIGTSMTEQFYIPKVNKILGGNFMKLSISGSTAYEQKLILSRALKYQNINRVIWGLDIYSLSGNIESYRNGKINFPLYLYDDNFLTDYKYLLNIDTFSEFFKIIKKYYIKKDRDYFDINNMFISHSINSKESALSAFYQDNLNLTFKKEDYLFEKMKMSFDKNILEVVNNNKNIEFHIYLPPYSILAWYKINKNGWLNEAFKLKQYIYNHLSKYSNVYFYDFQNDITFITNLENYIDTTHYTKEFNSNILEIIKDKRISQYNYISNDIMIKNINIVYDKYVTNKEQ